MTEAGGGLFEQVQVFLPRWWREELREVGLEWREEGWEGRAVAALPGVDRWQSPRE